MIEATAAPGGVDEKLIALVGAALKQFGPKLRLIYQIHEPAPGARCVIVFPQPETPKGSKA